MARVGVHGRRRHLASFLGSLKLRKASSGYTMRADESEGAVDGLAPAAVGCQRVAGSLHELPSGVRYAGTGSGA